MATRTASKRSAASTATKSKAPVSVTAKKSTPSTAKSGTKTVMQTSPTYQRQAAVAPQPLVSNTFNALKSALGNPSVKTTGTGAQTGGSTQGAFAGGYGVSPKPSTTSPFGAKPKLGTPQPGNIQATVKTIQPQLQPQTTGKALNTIITMPNGNTVVGQIVNGKTYYNGKPITSDPNFEGAKVTTQGGVYTIKGGAGVAEGQEQDMMPPELVFGEIPAVQEFAEDYYGQMGDYNEQMQQLIAQQNQMSPEQYYALAEKTLRPMFDTGKGTLDAQLAEANRQAGLTAEARGLTSSELERVGQAGNLSAYGKGLGELQSTYQQGVSQMGSQDYNTAVQRLNNMASQLGSAFQTSTGGMNDVLKNYLDAWQNVNANKLQGQQLNLGQKELEQDKWYKTELLKDADAKQKLDEYVAKTDAALRSRALSQSAASGATGPDAVAQAQNYVNFLGTVSQYVGAGQFNGALLAVNNNPLLTPQQKSDLRTYVTGAQGYIKIPQIGASSGYNTGGTGASISDPLGISNFIKK